MWLTEKNNKDEERFVDVYYLSGICMKRAVKLAWYIGAMEKCKQFPKAAL